MGNIDVIVNVLFGIYEILQAFFSGDLSPSSFVFSSFVVQFSRSVLLSALADSLYSISHRFRFVKRFFKTFLSFFFLFLASSFAHCLPSFRQLVYYITSPFVCQEVFSNFFKFLCPLSSSSRLSRYRSLKRAYILSLSSLFVNSFLSFFTFLSPTSLFCTLFILFLPCFCTHSLLRHFQVLYFYFTYICAALYLRYYILLPASICVIFSTPTPDPVGRPDFSRFIQTRCRRVEHGKEEISEKSAFLPNTRYKSARS